VALPRARLGNLKQEALRWTYALRNRERWNTQPEAGQQQVEMLGLATRLGLEPEDLEEIAAAALVEVEIPWRGERDGWEERIFPWEYMLASATRHLRAGKPLTVVRHLRRPGKARAGTPQRWLQVVSAPGSLGREYNFESERALVGFSAVGGSLDSLDDPDESALQQKVAELSPDVIHLAGFDNHQAARLVPSMEGRHADGYLLRGQQRKPESVGAEKLSRILTCGRKGAPRLVACNLHNSGQRIAPLCLAEGAAAAVGFQDSFDDGLAETFFATLYRAWRLTDWDIVRAFEYAWQSVRSRRMPLQGTGVVLWSEESIAASKRRLHGQASKRAIEDRWKKELQVKLGDGNIRDCVDVEVSVIPRLNYSILHNNGPLFERFQIRKTKSDVGRVDGIMVDIEVHVGTDSYPFRTTASIGEFEPMVDLPDNIRISLASTLTRSLRESVHTSLFVSVTWGKTVLYRQTHRVTLLPVDEWRFDGDNYRWLPSFVLPRDPAVIKVVDAAQRYLMALSDDATAGFDGYQSVPVREDKLPTPRQCVSVDMQVRALWSALLYEWPLSYINPPPVFTDSSQRLRTPSDCLEARRGTCIDLALLLAACLEYVEIYPTIFLLETHAFPAYWRHESYHEQFVAARGSAHEKVRDPEREVRLAGRGQLFGWDFQRGQFRELLGEVHAGRLVPLETTLVTGRGSFKDAMRKGLANLASREEFESMLDIALSRTDEAMSVTPLPIRRGEA
jgi:hypothetical protein